MLILELLLLVDRLQTVDTTPQLLCFILFSETSNTYMYIYIYIDQAPPILDLLEIRIGLLRAVLSSCFAEVGSRFSAFAHPICMMLI